MEAVFYLRLKNEKLRMKNGRKNCFREEAVLLIIENLKMNN